MPGFDGTGPMGRGAVTGGGRGYCGGVESGASAQPMNGRGFRGRGRGHGFRNCFYATGLPGWMRAQRGLQAFSGLSNVASREDEVAVLKDQASYLKDELDAVQSRLQGLESK